MFCVAPLGLQVGEGAGFAVSGGVLSAFCHRGGVVGLGAGGVIVAEVGASFCASFSRFVAVEGDSDTTGSSSGLRCPFGL